MQVHTNTLLRAAGAAVMAMAVASPALAQQDGGFDKPLKGNKSHAAAQGGSMSSMVMREDDGDNSYELRINGDDVSAKVNGKDVPQDRIVREDDQIKIMGKNGEVLKTFNVSRNGMMGHLAPVPGQPHARAGKAGAGEAAPEAQAEAQPRPKVMIGILMDKASEDQLKSAGLGEDDQAIAIQQVIPDLPAEKAGLKEGDVITEINGEKPATQEHLRDVLMGKKPGDTVTFTVQRDGEEKTVRVKLDKYDASKLPMPSTNAPGGAWSTGGPGDEAMRKLLKQYQVEPGQGFVMPGAPGGRGWTFVAPPGSGKMDERMGDLDKRLNELDEKLNKLNDQMSKLERMMEKMNSGHQKE